MRRAVAVLLLLAAGFTPALASAPVEIVDAIGNLDFHRGADFKVGDWVRYHALASNSVGNKTDYTVTILIAGAVEWWGEACFWVETQTTDENGETALAASLLSYDVFQDSLAALHFKLYIRKYVHGLDPAGKPHEELYLRPPSELTSREYEIPDATGQFDTLGTDRIEVPKGAYAALKTVEKHRPGTTSSEGDSTIYSEWADVNTRWSSRQVPITSLVRYDMERSVYRRAWVIGNSTEAPLQLMNKVIAKTELVDFGHGMKSKLFKDGFQHPIPDPLAAPAAPSAPRKAPGSGG